MQWTPVKFCDHIPIKTLSWFEGSSGRENSSYNRIKLDEKHLGDKRELHNIQIHMFLRFTSLFRFSFSKSMQARWSDEKLVVPKIALKILT